MTITTSKDGKITISGFEKGIADSPLAGLGDMRNIDIDSLPGAAQVGLSTAAMNQPPTVSAVAFTAATDDVFTVASTTGFYNGMAITLNTVGTVVGAVTGRVYWIGDLTATTFKLYKNPSRNAGQLVDITTAGSGTYSSYTLGSPIDKAVAYDASQSAEAQNYVFILDANGRVWWVDNTGGTITNNLVYLGNDTLTGSTGRAIAVFKMNLIVFREEFQDALHLFAIENNSDLDGAYAVGGGGWAYGWNSITGNRVALRAVLVGLDDVLYYSNGSNRLGSITEVVGETFEATDSTTYTENVNALDLPNNDAVQSIGELGTDLLIGGYQSFVYPWDRISPSFRSPLILPETNTYKIITGNNIAFLLSGRRGRIYVTNGSSVEEYKKISDYVTGASEPYFTWGDAILSRNQLFLSFTATENDLTALTTTGAVWSINTQTGALKCVNRLSYDSYAGSVPVLAPNIMTATPLGYGLYMGWAVSTTYGIDVSSTDPYTSFEAYLDTELISVGDFINAYMPNHFEFKLARPMVAGEQFRLSYRTNLTDNFTVIGTTTTATLSAEYDTNFDNVEWVQLRAEYSSTATTPSYVPLTAIIMDGSR